MVRPLFVFLLAVLVLICGFKPIHSEMVIEGGSTKESSGDCGTILTTVLMSQKQLDRLERDVQSITPNLRETIELKFYKLLEKIENIIESKFDTLDIKMDAKFHETKTYIDSKLTVIEDKMSEYTSHVDSKLKGLESTLTHALNVGDKLYNNNACCRASLETAALVKNTTTKINNINIRTLNITVKLQQMNEAIQNLTDIVVPSIVKNIPNQNDTTESTEPAHNVPDIITTTEVNKPAPSKCDRSQQEECCTVAVVGAYKFTEHTEMSARGRHTLVNMTSAGLQEYTMYFAVKGVFVELLLSSTSPEKENDLYYQIAFKDYRGGHIYMWQHLPTDPVRAVRTAVQYLDTTNIISKEHYTYYYVRISGDTLEVGRRGEPPLLTHTSSELRGLRYFSFLWSLSPAGEALYDCTAE